MRLFILTIFDMKEIKDHTTIEEFQDYGELLTMMLNEMPDLFKDLEITVKKKELEDIIAETQKEEEVSGALECECPLTA